MTNRPNAPKGQEDWPPAYVPHARGTGKIHFGLKTSVYRVAYDFVTKIGDVFMEEWSCTDKQGAIEFFQNIDPKVKRIRTWEGSHRDVEYVFEPNAQQWDDILHGKAR